MQRGRALSTCLTPYLAPELYGIIPPVRQRGDQPYRYSGKHSMTPPATPERYKQHRFPAEIIRHGVWLYYRFCLSYRDVEELLFVRRVLVTYEAIRKWCRKLLKGLTYVPRVLLTDKLKSYGAAKREMLPGVEHRQHCYLNHRAENSHQPTRQRSGGCKGLNHQGTPSVSWPHMVPSPNTSDRDATCSPPPAYRQEIAQRFQIWSEIPGTETAA